MDALNTEVSAYNTLLTNLLQKLKPSPRFNPNEEAKKVIATLKETNLSGDLSDLKQKYASNDFAKFASNVEAFRTTGKKDFFATYNYFTVSNWTYYVDPKTIEDDLTIFSVNITPKSDVACTPFTRSYELRVKAKSGIKLDFSTGLFANFGGSKFIDQSYQYDSVPGQPDRYKIVRNKAKNSVFPSIGALMHIYKRSGNDVNLAGVFGVSTRDLDKINYHLGGSLIFGTTRRVILSVGATWTKTTLINDNYSEGQVVAKADAPTTIPTDTFNRFGGFVAFTYNLSAK
ncbi:hypothetical protein LZZ85_13195 [Terrimonas sp. NA20]|uniref:DUF3575 domain-containing protein n=1 Tax=Terrimonas ginsenosidimutans TaxID=2908004 RepID=A0ABS9KSG3_9BACT|nr:hypothetical protein [Terrimonas ginsenosidimutans]MCG2615250.1 hypothetical protein [Terrimonas ginsenosidimutans]